VAVGVGPHERLLVRERDARELLDPFGNGIDLLDLDPVSLP